jgi:hypothetical protein
MSVNPTLSEIDFAMERQLRILDSSNIQSQDPHTRLILQESYRMAHYRALAQMAEMLRRIRR